jgi:hypothetical protein
MEESYLGRCKYQRLEVVVVEAAVQRGYWM